ncbi:MAG: hypothetical protein EXX96DRAFT_611576 [Benjaminiella poitrasii]|nr:MAG: hypothetical protein EXX96DRAFT_611576 [Benjaminiella poitrasii]
MSSMALSANNQFLSLTQSQETKPRFLFKHISYASAVKTNTRIFLVHDNVVIKPRMDNDDRISTFKSRIYSTTHSYGEFLFDVHIVMPTVHEQYPSIYVCVLLSSGLKHYLEVYIDIKARIRCQNKIIRELGLRVKLYTKEINNSLKYCVIISFMITISQVMSKSFLLSSEAGAPY